MLWWVLLFVGIALAGLAMVACLAVWLWHRVRDLLAELGVLAERGGELIDLLSQVEVPDPGLPTHSDRTAQDDWGRAATDVG